MRNAGKTRVQISIAVLLFVAVGVSAAENVHRPKIAQIRDGAPLLLVLSEKGDDPRLFSLNLDVSLNWSSFQSRDIEIREVTPPAQNPRMVADSVGVALAEFALVLIVPDGTVSFVTDSPSELRTVFQHVDDYLASR